jgi:hypothetical protein
VIDKQMRFSAINAELELLIEINKYSLKTVNCY